MRTSGAAAQTCHRPLRRAPRTAPRCAHGSTSSASCPNDRGASCCARCWGYTYQEIASRASWPGPRGTLSGIGSAPGLKRTPLSTGVGRRRDAGASGDRWRPDVLTVSRVDRSPAEVSLYLGLATAIATFTAAAVALGLLRCSGRRERASSIAVVLFATVGIAAALIAVARGRTSGFGNVLIGAGLLSGAVFVLTRAMRLIFSPPGPHRTDRGPKFASSSSTQDLPIVWTSWRDASINTHPASQPAVLRGALRASSAGFVVVVLVATAGAAPDVRDLLHDFLRSRPVGQQALAATCRGTPLARPVATSSSPAANALLRHYRLISAGDYEEAFALMTPRYRSANPGWVHELARIAPRINVADVGPVTQRASVAVVPIRFYGRGCRSTSASDTTCRRFRGNARMVRAGARWRYDAPGDYLATALPDGTSFCP